jgi:hypothetical protein
MQDPGRRPPGTWPRDRPVRWTGVAGNMAWFVIGTVAGAFQIALALPVLAVGHGWLGIALALVWGALTLFAAWAWLFGKWRIVLAPILTALAIVAVRQVGGPPPPPVAGPFLTDNPAGVVEGVAYRPAIDPTVFTTSVTNRYMPLVPGTTLTYEGDSERVVVTVTTRTRTVMGIEAVVVRDSVYVGDSLVEDTEDWFAQDVAGNVWYFGEDTADCRDGAVVTHAGAWEAGIDGAQPGIVMLADPRVGDFYRQEFYPGHAEDMARVRELDARLVHPQRAYDDVLVTEDFTPLERGQIEHKWFAPDVGLVEARPPSDEGDALRLIEVKLATEQDPSEAGSLCQG